MRNSLSSMSDKFESIPACKLSSRCQHPSLSDSAYRNGCVSRIAISFIPINVSLMAASAESLSASFAQRQTDGCVGSVIQQQTQRHQPLRSHQCWIASSISGIAVSFVRVNVSLNGRVSRIAVQLRFRQRQPGWPRQQNRCQLHSRQRQPGWPRQQNRCPASIPVNVSLDGRVSRIASPLHLHQRPPERPRHLHQNKPGSLAAIPHW